MDPITLMFLLGGLGYIAWGPDPVTRGNPLALGVREGVSAGAGVLREGWGSTRTPRPTGSRSGSSGSSDSEGAAPAPTGRSGSRSGTATKTRRKAPALSHRGKPKTDWDAWDRRSRAVGRATKTTWKRGVLLWAAVVATWKATGQGWATGVTTWRRKQQDPDPAQGSAGEATPSQQDPSTTTMEATVSDTAATVGAGEYTSPDDIQADVEALRAMIEEAEVAIRRVQETKDGMVGKYEAATWKTGGLNTSMVELRSAEDPTMLRDMLVAVETGINEAKQVGESASAVDAEGDVEGFKAK